MERCCETCQTPATELRRLPLGIEVAGWICLDCWRERWRPHWPAWSTLVDFDWLYRGRSRDPRQGDLFTDNERREPTQ